MLILEEDDLMLLEIYKAILLVLGELRAVLAKDKDDAHARGTGDGSLRRTGPSSRSS